jgi:serine/threonine-protein kinase
MSPEQIMPEKGLTALSDLFALGVILFELTTAERLFFGKDNFAVMMQIVEADVAERLQMVDQYVPGFSGVLAKALTKTPEDRWQSAQEFGVALRRLRNDLPGVVTLKDMAAMLMPFDPTDTFRMSALPDALMGQEVEHFAKSFFAREHESWDPLAEESVDNSDGAAGSGDADPDSTLLVQSGGAAGSTPPGTPAAAPEKAIHDLPTVHLPGPPAAEVTRATPPPTPQRRQPAPPVAAPQQPSAAPAAPATPALEEEWVPTPAPKRQVRDPADLQLMRKKGGSTKTLMIGLIGVAVVAAAVAVWWFALR